MADAPGRLIEFENIMQGDHILVELVLPGLRRTVEGIADHLEYAEWYTKEGNILVARRPTLFNNDEATKLIYLVKREMLSEPKGLGAVVDVIFERSDFRRWIRTSAGGGNNLVVWIRPGYPSSPNSWSSITASHQITDIKLMSEGVQ